MLARQPKHPFDCHPTLFTARDLARKEALRAHVDQLPLDQQRQFVLVAALLIGVRMSHSPESLDTSAGSTSYLLPG